MSQHYVRSSMILYRYVINEPRHEENRSFAYAKTKTQISFAVTAKLISAFVFATQIAQFVFYINLNFSSFLPSSIVEQVGLCRTCSETPKTDFLASRLKYNMLYILWEIFLILQEVVVFCQVWKKPAT